MLIALASNQQIKEEIKEARILLLVKLNILIS